MIYLENQHHQAGAHNTCEETGLKKNIWDQIIKLLKWHSKMIGLGHVVIEEDPFKDLQGERVT